ncbi:hypothetical protein BDA99DRAFT_568926, partial [Phascolomyces articulosus]
WNGYFDPLLNPISLGRNKASRSRPDAVVSILTQPVFVDGIRYGEVKVAEPTRNYDSVGRDLLLLGIFCKTSIDGGFRFSPIGFQIHACFGDDSQYIVTYQQYYDQSPCGQKWSNQELFQLNSNEIP